ncbi:hypothetical protein CDL15_Pgr009145 [Punica granatum]|uniref:Uncharacterized protein n=1 Tax=Punica granatum TaxID=22663 RepID=A0A218WJJ8_PUNGR|nr:hypothetical protein CDL15_Pgr009145 [Punica granatum]PKI66537.1 hypothetical protein CRG98_013064 [Punica granatum]
MRFGGQWRLVAAIPDSGGFPTVYWGGSRDWGFGSARVEEKPRRGIGSGIRSPSLGYRGSWGLGHGRAEGSAIEDLSSGFFFSGVGSSSGSRA